MVKPSCWLIVLLLSYGYFWGHPKGIYRESKINLYFMHFIFLSLQKYNMDLDTIVQKLLLMFRMVQLYAFIGGTNVTGFSNFNLVNLHLIATTLAGPGQCYKLYLCFVTFMPRLYGQYGVCPDDSGSVLDPAVIPTQLLPSQTCTPCCLGSISPTREIL